MSVITKKVISWFDSHALEVDDCIEEKVDWFRALPFILMHLTPFAHLFLWIFMDRCFCLCR